MNKRFMITALTGLFAILITIYSCTKLDTTTLGTDVIPVVDNINTFADTLSINTTQGIFNDTSTISSADDHALGLITNDELFGKTDASIYFQLKPRFFPYYLGQANDTVIGIDSIVLALKYRGFYGDSTIPQSLEVSEVAQTAGGLWDSVYQSRPVNFVVPTASVLGRKTIDIRNLKNLVKFGNNKDSATYQIRIKLDQDPAWLSSFISQDSTTSGANNSFLSDSLYTKRNKGLAVRSTSLGNALMYINLHDDGTRLEVHFRKKKNNIVDTVFSTFILKTSPLGGIKPSVTANLIKRDRSGSPLLTSDPNLLYLQTTPGTFGLLNIPGLTSFKDTNRIIHRAEVFMEQAPGTWVMDSLFTAPNFLYMDLRDSTAAEFYKPVYYDLNPGFLYNPDNTTNYYPLQVDYGYFGGYLRRRTDHTTGRNLAYYNFNITRYVQKMVINHSYNYTLRLFAPFSLNYPKYGKTVLNYANSMAFGRVRVGGGANSVHKMKMVIIWSKVK